MLLGDLPVGTQVQFKDYLALIERQDGHAVHGRTLSGIRFGVRKTHECQQCSDPVIGVFWTVNARALHVSPSQLTQFMYQCPRQWALDKIGGIHRQGNKFSDRGGRVHKVLEDWQRYAKPPDLTDPIGQIAYPALALTPAPGTATPERCVNWEVGGIEIEFLKDLEQVSPHGVEIWDYKTTSNLTYAHTAAELLGTDPQAITYAAHAFIEFQAPAVRENWLYLTANKPHRCLPVVVDPDPTDCLRRFELILAAGRIMIAHRVAQTDPGTFPQNPSHCSAFGGCPYKGVHCHPDEVRSLIDQMTQSIFSQMAAVGQPAPTPPAPVQPTAIAWPPAAAPITQPVPAAPIAQPVPPTASATPPLWMQAALPVTPPVTQLAPASDPSFAGQGILPVPASVPGWLTPAQPPPAATVTPEVVVPPPAAVPAKAKRPRRTDTTPTTLEIQASPETDGPFWEILESLAMNPSLAAMPAVDLVDRALSLLENGKKAIGQ